MKRKEAFRAFMAIPFVSALMSRDDGLAKQSTKVAVKVIFDGVWYYVIPNDGIYSHVPPGHGKYKSQSLKKVCSDGESMCLLHGNRQKESPEFQMLPQVNDEFRGLLFQSEEA